MKGLRNGKSLQGNMKIIYPYADIVYRFKKIIQI